MNEEKILSDMWVNAVLCVLKYKCLQLMHSLEVQVVMQPDVTAKVVSIPLLLACPLDEQVRLQ